MADVLELENAKEFSNAHYVDMSNMAEGYDDSISKLKEKDKRR